MSASEIKHDVLAAIGNTPLIRLKGVSERTRCEILGKAEFMNPGQSVKDRAALFIIQDAMRKGRLKPGGTVVEGTAGNTGIGIAVVGNALGLKSGIVLTATQSQEKVDGFVCSVGTGGTLAGVAIALKERNAGIVTAVADPLGAAIYSWIKTGELKSEGNSITEGIGQSRVTGNLVGAPIDDAFQIPDEEALPLIFELLEKEGLCLGGSSGINVAGAMRFAQH